MLNDLVSVVVPVYNAERHLPRCIESILGQTHRRIQLILVNDASTDSSSEICNYYRIMDDRIIVVDSETGGASAARNLGLELATGDYIGFVDSDDYVEPELYATLLRHIRRDQIPVCTMSPYVAENWGRHSPVHEAHIISAREALKQLLLLRFPISLGAYLYSREAVDNLHLNEGIHVFEDFEFNCRVLSRLDRVSLCHQSLYNYVHNPEGASAQRIGDRRLTCLKIYELVREHLKDTHADLIPYLSYAQARFLISVIVSLAQSGLAEGKYYRITQAYSRDRLPGVFFSCHVPLSYKAVILMCSANAWLSCMILRLVIYR